MWKFISRKLVVIILNFLIIGANKKYNLGLTDPDIISLASVSGAYVLGQSYVDSVEKKHKD